MIPKVETTFFFFLSPLHGGPKVSQIRSGCRLSFLLQGTVGQWGRGTEDFTAFMALCRLDSLSVSSLEGAEEQRWHGKIVEKCISYLGWGQKAMKVGLVKAERVPGMTVVLEP